MLGRSLTPKRWLALVVLTVGVAIVQFPGSHNAPPAIDESQSQFYFPRSFHELGQLSNGAVEVARELTKRGLADLSEGLTKRSATYEGIQEDMGLVKPIMNYSIGLSSVLVAAAVSGLTGVYFEKVLKESTQNVTVWIRNVQLSFYSLFPALIIGVILKDGEEIAENGFFDGYNAVVWTSIVFQAVGGVLVAMCIHYADNIAKNFATSISIILSFFFSVYFFEFPVTFNVGSHAPLSTIETSSLSGITNFSFPGSLSSAPRWSYLQHISIADQIGNDPDLLQSISQVTRRQRSTMGLHQSSKTRRSTLCQSQWSR